MARRPWFKFWVSDWLSSLDLQVMGAAGAGAFINLLAVAWLQPGCSLPDDDKALAIASRLGPDWDGEIGRMVRAKFREESGRLYNDRLLEEFHATTVEHQSLSEAGRKGAEARKRAKTSAATGKAKATLKPGYSQAEARPQAGLEAGHDGGLEPGLSMSEVRYQKKNTLPTLSTDCEREGVAGEWDQSAALHEFLDGYPKATKRDAAARAYLSIIDAPAKHAELMGGLERWKASDTWRRSLRDDGGRYVVDPDKFIFNRLFADNPEPFRETGGAANSALDEAMRMLAEEDARK